MLGPLAILTITLGVLLGVFVIISISVILGLYVQARSRLNQAKTESSKLVDRLLQNENVQEQRVTKRSQNAEKQIKAIQTVNRISKADATVVYDRTVGAYLNRSDVDASKIEDVLSAINGIIIFDSMASTDVVGKYVFETTADKQLNRAKLIATTAASLYVTSSPASGEEYADDYFDSGLDGSKRGIGLIVLRPPLFAPSMVTTPSPLEAAEMSLSYKVIVPILKRGITLSLSFTAFYYVVTTTTTAVASLIKARVWSTGDDGDNVEERTNVITETPIILPTNHGGQTSYNVDGVNLALITNTTDDDVIAKYGDIIQIYCDGIVGTLTGDLVFSRLVVGVVPPKLPPPPP